MWKCVKRERGSSFKEWKKSKVERKRKTRNVRETENLLTHWSLALNPVDCSFLYILFKCQEVNRNVYHKITSPTFQKESFIQCTPGDGVRLTKTRRDRSEVFRNKVLSVAVVHLNIRVFFSFQTMYLIQSCQCGFSGISIWKTFHWRLQNIGISLRKRWICW